MERPALTAIAVLAVLLVVGSFLFWRYVWFFRNPERSIPPGDNIVSPADGTVVYVKDLSPGDDVIVIKEGVSASISDIVKEDLELPRLLVGIFMSPFDVHYNRAPLKGVIEFIGHHPAIKRNINMRPMHVRTLLGMEPYYEDSIHIVQNERKVTKFHGTFKGRSVPCYVVQIAGGHVDGIDSFFDVGHAVEKGEIFGMIRIGSQVDIILPRLPQVEVSVKPGDKVKAGETILYQ